ncbi:hypothetical protein [Roseibium sp.]|uniref:hypothetical protein n=1 Tax=Roseibium sp. TaxID=1936156 RepID=UPI003A97CFD7
MPKKQFIIALSQSQPFSQIFLRAIRRSPILTERHAPFGTRMLPCKYAIEKLMGLGWKRSAVFAMPVKKNSQDAPFKPGPER